MQLKLNIGTGRAYFQTQCSSKLIFPSTQPPHWHKNNPEDLTINVAERIPPAPRRADSARPHEISHHDEMSRGSDELWVIMRLLQARLVLNLYL